MPTQILAVTAYDIRFPTSRALDGSDAMHPDPDYSAAYVILQTDHPAGLEGHGLTFTCGRGTELCVAAVQALAPLVQGRTLEEITANMAAFWRTLTSDGQLRWVGPEKGCSTWPPRPWSTPSGISGPRWRASRSGSWWWT